VTTPRLLIMGCVKTKGTEAAPASDLYQGQLWQLRRQYAEASGHPWVIVSAQLGIVDPLDPIRPYDRTMGETLASEELYARWSEAVYHGLRGALVRNGIVGQCPTLEVHAGASYVAALRDEIKRLEGCLWFSMRAQDSLPARIEHPVKGLQIGELKRWYREQLGLATPKPIAPRAARAPRQMGLFDPVDLIAEGVCRVG